MKIAVIGTGYVGLVTGVALSEIGHVVTCIDVDPSKVERLSKGIPTIYEPGLEELIKKNIGSGNLRFTSEHQKGLPDAEVVYIAVGTPQRADGAANLDYVEQAALDIAANIKRDIIVVIKSTVPVGTNFHIRNLINQHTMNSVRVKIASNPEFLREGSAVEDTFHGDRIVIGAEDAETGEILAQINKPFNTPIVKTDISSAEMIKYSSNAFLATKISFINEIANLCESMGANVEEVAKGMGLDHRIGPDFLKAGIGYGGSCFPKDTNALVQLAGNANHEFNLLKSVIEVNNNQQVLLLHKILSRFGDDIQGKRVAVLGLAFKPNTDDLRESPALVIIPKLVELGANVIAYDPIAVNNAKKQLGTEIGYTEDFTEALKNADFTVIITDWSEVKKANLSIYSQLMKEPIVFDGRNCYDLNEVKKATIEYYSIGRPDQAPELIG
ncbi:UDP-glucose/GDP-mannose dehydrogenase family protein [Sporolactobacillus shoreicorticis]|uniref:UDP-glucose 6-dehydrogenase n=1 Tax=Sporolactobacillus shoreicorticis TaxID=1923877 RepID=A0ABW5S3E2_9BACL|nr:UDP-glucose/GDP-mannose dehydrogenase family protein [Sporolactobacillus shoreicorticis]MCO7124176.1 UDP-glucose/GDP-mannose dehydrogenase family protein [Sporolactobacillus shoreicorticis]